MKSPQLIFLAAFAVAPAAYSSQTNTIVVPKETAIHEDMAHYFGGTYGGLVGQQQEQVYFASNFSEIGTNVVIQITSIAFRWDETWTNSIDTITRGADFWIGALTHVSNNMYENWNYLRSAIHTGSMHLVAPANRPAEEFDVQFPLQVPFTYDPRVGSLILIGALYDVNIGFDGEANAEAGYLRYFEPGGYERGTIVTTVTKFSYKILPSITSADLNGDVVDIAFTGPSDAQLQVFGSATVQGPYDLESNAEVSRISEHDFEATIPIKSGTRFFKIESSE